jgi:hypothetical protein
MRRFGAGSGHVHGPIPPDPVCDPGQSHKRLGIRAEPRVGAVWFVGHMGLLDDAIREHLELKRLRGADPGDVARAEQAALGPVPRGDGIETDGRHAEDAEEAPSERPFTPDSGAGDSPGDVQETVELNMEAEIAASASEGDLTPSGGEYAAPAAHPAHAQESSGESLEWEMPGDRPAKLPPEERVPSDVDQGAEAGAEGANEPVEDVLEETPDFLRDTPEQERLWFEQRPPRDFDFNE